MVVFLVKRWQTLKKILHHKSSLHYLSKLFLSFVISYIKFEMWKKIYFFQNCLVNLFTYLFYCNLISIWKKRICKGVFFVYHFFKEFEQKLYTAVLTCFRLIKWQIKQTSWKLLTCTFGTPCMWALIFGRRKSFSGFLVLLF